MQFLDSDKELNIVIKTIAEQCYMMCFFLQTIVDLINEMNEILIMEKPFIEFFVNLILFKRFALRSTISIRFCLCSDDSDRLVV